MSTSTTFCLRCGRKMDIEQDVSIRVSLCPCGFETWITTGDGCVAYKNGKNCMIHIPEGCLLIASEEPL